MRSRVLLALSFLASSAVAQTFFPPAPVPAGNPMTQDKALLGMALFWEEQMSSANTMACGTCHVFSHGGADPRTGVNPGADRVYNTADDVHASPGVVARSTASRFAPAVAFGMNTQVTPRKAPTIINAAYSTALFYDGRVTDGVFRDPMNTATTLLASNAHLENLVLQPPLNPIEMGHTGRTWTDVANKIRDARPLALAGNLPARLQSFVAGQSYPQLFNRAWGTTDVTPARIAMSLATYIRTLIADQSPFDRFVAGVGQLTPQAQLGMTVFTRAVTGPTALPACSQCHGDITAQSHQVGPRFEQTTPYSGGMFGGATHNNFHNTGIRPIADDRGRAVVTSLPNDEGRFKVPMLRNVALRAPFFHTGGMAALTDVVSFYDRGGDFHTNQATEIRPRSLTAAEQAGVVAFLQALTDPRVQAEQAPFDRPTLGSERNIAPVVIGTGMQTSAGSPARSIVEGPPVIGTAGYAVGLAGVPANVPVFLMWDMASVPGGMPMFGMQIYLAMSPSFQAVGVGLTTTGNGTAYASASFPIPNQPALTGFTLYGQWLLGDPQSTLGFASSDAFSLTVQ